MKTPVLHLVGMTSCKTEFPLRGSALPTARRGPSRSKSPAGASDLEVRISGGSGDADLYVRKGSEPTTSSYDCRPYKNGNSESCSFSAPDKGTWYVMLRAYDAFSNVRLIAEWDEFVGSCTPGGGSESGLADSTGGQKVFYVDVPACATELKVSLGEGSGDADLYVRFGSEPTTFSYDCRSWAVGNNESCTFAPPRKVATTSW